MKRHKYDLSGEQIGEVVISDRIAKAEANGQMIKDYIVAIRENQRQWSASTKGRSDVKHTTKKSHPQKGTGRARHGSIVAPQFRGGGVVFGPKPKFDQHVSINKKERRAAIRALIGEKVRSGNFHVLSGLKMEAPKTQVVARFLDKLGCKKRVLFIGEGRFEEVEVAGKKSRVSVKCDHHRYFSWSVSNIKQAEFALAANISGYDLIKAHDLVITEEALRQVEEWLQ